MTLLFARTDLYLKNSSICTSRICMRINYLSVCLSVCLSVFVHASNSDFSTLKDFVLYAFLIT